MRRSFSARSFVLTNDWNADQLRGVTTTAKPSDVERVLLAYPMVWFACHARHARGRDGEGVSERDRDILVHLAAAEPARATALARHLGIQKSTLSEAIDSLEARGLVARRRREDDKRRVDVTLTRLGRTAVRRGSGLEARRVARVLGRLGSSDRQRALAGLEALARACLAEMSGDERRPAAAR